MGTNHRPHSVRSCEPALHAEGLAGGRPRGGGASRRRLRRLGSGALPSPAAHSWGRQLASAADWLWARVCGCGDAALALWCARPAGCHAPQGWRRVVRGRGVSLTPVRGVLCQALSLSQLPVLGAGSRVLLPVFVRRGRCGRRDPAPAPQHALWRPGVARCGGGRRASLGGDALRHCEGRLRLGARPPPAAHP